MKETNTPREGRALLRLFTIAGLALVAIGLLAASVSQASAGGPPPAGKSPRLQNIWLCNFESAFSDNCNREADIGFFIDPTIRTADPKCVGFPNFRPDAECDRQVVGGWEFEVRFDQKYIDVQLEPGYRLREGIDNCARTKGQGFVQIRCNTKGKDGHLAGIERLAVARITATPDTHSILMANQLNGIVTQLINQDCNLADTQGHPIPLDRGNDWCANDGAVTIRYLEGDVHADCVIDVHDQQQIAFRWGSHLGQLLYNSNFDLEPSSPKLGDGDIDAKDLQTVFGRHESNCKAPHPAQDPVDPKAKVEPGLNVDEIVDADGIATGGTGIPGAVEVTKGATISFWPAGGNEGIDDFDNDASGTWTPGDDLHLEDPSGACSTASRDAVHNLGADCVVLDLNGSFFDGQPVTCDLEGFIPFSSPCPPSLGWFDANGDSSYNNGEDIILDVDGNGIYD